MTEKKKATPPTLEEVAETEGKLAQIRGRLEVVQVRLAEITEALARLRASGEEDLPEAKNLRAERAALRSEGEEVGDALPLLEEAAREAREAAAWSLAERELKALVRKAGANVEDAERKAATFVGAARDTMAAAAALSSSWSEHEGYHDEAEALSRRFGLPMPELAAMTAPGHVPGVREAADSLRGVQTPVRPRSNFKALELDPGSPASRILQEAGPLTGPEPTPEELEREREERREREQAELAGVLSGISPEQTR